MISRYWLFHAQLYFMWTVITESRALNGYRYLTYGLTGSSPGIKDTIQTSTVAVKVLSVSWNTRFKLFTLWTHLPTSVHRFLGLDHSVTLQSDPKGSDSTCWCRHHHP